MARREMIEPSDFILADILEVLLRIESKLSDKKPKQKATAKPKAKKTVAVKPVTVIPKDTRARKVCSTCGQIHENGWEYGVCARQKKREGV
jgi:hypothetical protein